jgi:hypothetical protein
MRGSPVFVPILRCLPSRVAFLGAMRDFLLSRALLPLIPPTPFSHKGRRGLLGILMAETKDGTQGPKKPAPVRDAARTPTTAHTLGARASRSRRVSEGTLLALPRRRTPWERGRPARVASPRARCSHSHDGAHPGSAGVPPEWSSRGDTARAPATGDTAAYGQDDRAPRRCSDAHRSREQGTFQNDYASPRQECSLSIKIRYRRKSDRKPPLASGCRR